MAVIASGLEGPAGPTASPRVNVGRSGDGPRGAVGPDGGSDHGRAPSDGRGGAQPGPPRSGEPSP